MANLNCLILSIPHVPTYDRDLWAVTRLDCAETHGAGRGPQPMGPRGLGASSLDAPWGGLCILPPTRGTPMGL
jgi:hypothetical protein